MEVEKESLKEDLKLTDRFDVFNLLIATVGIILINTTLFGVVRNISQLSVKLIVSGILINLVLIYYTVSLYISKIKFKKLKIYAEYLDIKNKSLMELNDNIRCFKHDFNNIIQAIDGYILMGDMEALKVYFSKLLKECNHMKNLEILACNKVINPAIYGVLVNKYKLAEKKNIKMNIDILMDFSRINKKAYCISRILGILLDNAIEAALESDEKVVNVQFFQENTKGKRFIVVENSYKNKSVDTGAIFEKNYTTKAENGNSGIGLWKVRNMLENETEIELITTKDGKMFKQEIEIFL